MTESEQVKAALAALAAGECEQTTGTSDERPASPTQDGGFEWGAPETTGQVAPEQRGATTDYRAVIERAVAATEDVEAAAAFVDSVGLDRLEAAVSAAEREVSGLAADGRAALATFERFRAAAAGATEP